MTGKSRIMLVDDHAILRSGLKLLINGQPDMEVVAEAASAAEALAACQQVQPEILLLDLGLPDNNGLEIINKLKKLPRAPRVLVLTMYDDENYLKEALRLGADGYIVKRAADEELLRAIRQVARGQVFIDPNLTRNLVQDLLRRPAATTATALPEVLSEREKEVLRLVALGYTNLEIAGRLSISVKTVESHKSHIKDKLGLKSRAEMVRYCLKQGWLPEA